MNRFPQSQYILEANHIAARRRATLVGERFEGAALLLASIQIGERIAGIALLRALWQDDESGSNPLGEAIEEVLSAFVRRRTGGRDGETKIAPDVQSALSALGKRPAAFQSRPLDLSGARLSGVEWPFAHLSGALLVDTDLRGALLVGADLRGTWLRGADLGLANLDDADLRGADLRGARGTDPAQLRNVKSDERTLWSQPVAKTRLVF